MMKLKKCAILSGCERLKKGFHYGMAYVVKRMYLRHVFFLKTNTVAAKTQPESDKIVVKCCCVTDSTYVTGLVSHRRLKAQHLAAPSIRSFLLMRSL